MTSPSRADLNNSDRNNTRNRSNINQDFRDFDFIFRNPHDNFLNRIQRTSNSNNDIPSSDSTSDDRDNHSRNRTR